MSSWAPSPLRIPAAYLTTLCLLIVSLLTLPGKSKILFENLSSIRMILAMAMPIVCLWLSISRSCSGLILPVLHVMPVRSKYVPDEATLLVDHSGSGHPEICDGLYDLCTQNQASTNLLHPLLIPSGPWSYIALDSVKGLPNYRGKTVILDVVAFPSLFNLHRCWLSMLSGSIAYPQTWFLIQIHSIFLRCRELSEWS